MKLKTFSLFNSKNARLFWYGFFKKFPQWQQFNTGKVKDFSRIIKEFHLDFMETVAEERYGAELPLRLGLMQVVAYKSNRGYPNFNLFGSSGVKTTYSNNHTDGLKCRIIYINSARRYRIKDRFLWEFRGETVFRQIVSKKFVQNYSKYIVSPIRSRDNIDWQLQVEENQRHAIEKFLLTYDEFNMN